MKAIVCKYHGPTNTRGSRISASAEGGNRISIPYPHELSGEDVYRAAAEALCKKMNWPGKLAGGGTEDSHVFVFVDKNTEDFNAMMEALEYTRLSVKMLVASGDAKAHAPEAWLRRIEETIAKVSV